MEAVRDSVTGQPWDRLLAPFLQLGLTPLDSARFALAGVPAPLLRSAVALDLAADVTPPEWVEDRMDWPTYLVQLLARLLATFPDEWPAQLVEPLPGLPGELSGEMAEGDDILLSAAAGFRSQTSDVSSLLARFGAHSAEAPDDETRTAFADGITGTALLWRGNLEGEASSRDSSDILLELLGGRRADNPEDELWCIYEWTLGFNRSMSLLGAGNPLAQQLADAASGLTDDVVSSLRRPPDVRAHTAETSEEPDDGDGRESEELRVRRAWLQWLDATDGDVSAASACIRSGMTCDTAHEWGVTGVPWERAARFAAAGFKPRDASLQEVASLTDEDLVAAAKSPMQSAPGMWGSPSEAPEAVLRAERCRLLRQLLRHQKAPDSSPPGHSGAVVDQTRHPATLLGDERELEAARNLTRALRERCQRVVNISEQLKEAAAKVDRLCDQVTREISQFEQLQLLEQQLAHLRGRPSATGPPAAGVRRQIEEDPTRVTVPTQKAPLSLAWVP